MAVQIFDIKSSPTVPDEQTGVNPHIEGSEVPGNVAYTYITVKSTAHNDTRTKALTASGDSVPAEEFGGQNKFSAVSRFQASIGLPLPKNIPFQWNNDWSQQETGFLEQAINSTWNGSYSDLPGQAVDAFKNKMVDMAPIIGLRKLMQKSVGAVANPFKEIYYNGVSFRQFTFNWEFSPSNAAEAQGIEDLIYYLELSSHPELIGSETSNYRIPDVFNIEFKGTKIQKLQTLALTSMNVEYAQFGPKVMKDQHMAFVEMSLSFLEMYPLTKEDIRTSRSRKIDDLFPSAQGSLI